MQERFHRFRYVRFAAGTTVRWNVNLQTKDGTNLYYFSTYLVVGLETLDDTAVGMANIYRIAERVAFSEHPEYEATHRISDTRLFSTIEQFLTVSAKRVELGNGASVVDLNCVVRPSRGEAEAVVDLL